MDPSDISFWFLYVWPLSNKSLLSLANTDIIAQDY